MPETGDIPSKIVVAKPAPSMWSPFHHKPFAVMGVATRRHYRQLDVLRGPRSVMTSLAPAPVMVSLVQVAATLRATATSARTSGPDGD